jgi:hypothetical protein
MLHPLWLFCGLVSLAIVFLVIGRPLFLTAPVVYCERPSPEGMSYFETLGILEMLNDLENDFKMGRLTREDYELLALEYQHRYLESIGPDGRSSSMEEPLKG